MIIFKAGNVASDLIANLVTAFVSTSTTARFSTFETPGGVDYTVPEGKCLVIGLVVHVPTAANYSFQLGYGDDGVGDSATPPTNAKSLTGDIYSLQAMVASPHLVTAVIPSGKLPYWKSTGGGGNVTIMGFLTDNPS